MQDPNKQVDWAFIRAIAEVMRSQSISKRMTDSINLKAYLMFLCQYNRQFVVALSFTAAKKSSLLDSQSPTEKGKFIGLWAYLLPEAKSAQYCSFAFSSS